jgi:hypothetical protein
VEPPGVLDEEDLVGSAVQHQQRAPQPTEVLGREGQVGQRLGQHLLVGSTLAERLDDAR